MPDREKVIAWLADEELYYREHGDTHNSLMACYALALLHEQEEKPMLDEFGRCFLNALKRQLDMKLQMIELLITPEFAEKIVELVEKVFD